MARNVAAAKADAEARRGKADRKAAAAVMSKALRVRVARRESNQADGGGGYEWRQKISHCHEILH